MVNALLMAERLAVATGTGAVLASRWGMGNLTST